MKKTTVLVIDDHPFFRSGIAQWLEAQPDLCCCGEAGSIQEARSFLAKNCPDIILADLHLADGDGLDLISELSELYPAARIIALSQLEEDFYAHRALRAGARGYVMKTEAVETVKEAIATACRGEIYLSRRVAARLATNLFPDKAGDRTDLAKLSDRELQVFRMLGARMGTRQIAEKLKISPKTVETYRENLKTKLNLPSGAKLVAAAELWVQTGKGPAA